MGPTPVFTILTKKYLKQLKCSQRKAILKTVNKKKAEKLLDGNTMYNWCN